MWSRACLGVVLDAEHRICPVFQPSQCAVVQVGMRLRHILRQRRRIHVVVMVLRGNLNLARLMVQDRVIPAMMSELQLVGLAAERKSEDLVAKTDPK